MRYQSSLWEGFFLYRFKHRSQLLGAFERTPDVVVIRAAVKGEQLHAMRTLHLITVPYPLRTLPEHLRAAKAFDLDLLVYHGGAPK
jgi:hypothetical protein